MTKEQIAELILSNPDLWGKGSYFSVEGTCCALGMASCVTDKDARSLHIEFDRQHLGIVQANDSSRTPQEAALNIANLTPWTFYD